MRNKRLSAGLTLVELMITVAIIGILASTAIALFKDQQLRSKRVEGTTNVEVLVKMLKAQFGENGSYPSVPVYFPAGCCGPAAQQWDAASRAGFAAIGFNPEGGVRFHYDVDSSDSGECGTCASGACFTVAGFSDLDGNAAVGGVGYFQPDNLGNPCPTVFGGWMPPLDSGGSLVLNQVVAMWDPVPGGPDKY